MEKELRENIIYDLGHEIYDYLENDDNGGDDGSSELFSLVANSGCVMWGYDTINSLETWSDEDDEVGFTCEIVFSGDHDRKSVLQYDSLTMQVKGIAVLQDSHWHISDCEILSIQPYKYPYDDDYLFATVTANEDYFATFQSEIARLKELNAVKLSSDETQVTLQRLTFSGAITCLETYLMDALVHRVLTRPETLKSFFNNFEFDKGTEKVHLKEVANNEDILEKTAKRELSKILYHNVVKVSEIYKAVLNVSFPALQDIIRDVLMRHDLVHRNGKNVDGEVVAIDAAAVDDVLNRVEAFIGEINADIGALDAVPF